MNHDRLMELGLHPDLAVTDPALIYNSDDEDIVIDLHALAVEEGLLDE